MTVTKSILKEDLSTSTIHIINKLIRSATNKLQVTKVDSDYFTFTDKTIDCIISLIKNKSIKSAIVIDDLGFQIINRLINIGVKNITLILARTPRKYIALISTIITKTFNNIKINIKHIEEIEETMETELVISNPPYGKIGADITKVLREKINFKEYINLEPGNDYFTNNNYKYIDANIKPTIFPVGSFSDANQTTTATHISKQENNLTQTGARLLLSIQNGDEAVYRALSELWLNTEKYGILKFTQSKKDLKYDSDTFVFNPGAFDIGHGYFAVAQREKWTSSTEYNIYKKDAIGHINLPKAKVKGCESFIKLVYSELGLKIFKLWFTSSPEGWGFATGMFADIDYSDCKTWNDAFDKLSISKTNQDILIAAANKFELSIKEKEICRIVEETL